MLLSLETEAVAQLRRPGAGDRGTSDCGGSPAGDENNRELLAGLRGDVQRQVGMLIQGLPLPSERSFTAALCKRDAAGGGVASQRGDTLARKFLGESMVHGAQLDELWVGPLLRDTVRPVSMARPDGLRPERSLGQSEASSDLLDAAIAPAGYLTPDKLRRSLAAGDSDRIWHELQGDLRRSRRRRLANRWAASAAAAAVLVSLATFIFRGTREKPEFVFTEVTHPVPGSWLAVAPLQVLPADAETGGAGSARDPGTGTAGRQQPR